MFDWPFADPPNVATFTTRSVVEGGAWVARVSHDGDGAWQFHGSSPAPAGEDDAMLVSLRSMVERDLALCELADLPKGWVAVILDVTANVPHVFQGLTGRLDEADHALDRAAIFIAQQVTKVA